MKEEIQHVLTVVSLFSFNIVTVFFFNLLETDYKSNINTFPYYGTFVTIVLYIVRILPLMCLLPVALSNFIGLVYFNTQRSGSIPMIKTSTLFAPFICFRVFVGNGTLPEYALETIQRNVETCLTMGLKNFVFDIVTARPLGISNAIYLRERIVKKGDRCGKARALHHCLEQDTNLFSDGDWSVHLNEGTLITDASVISLVNFIYDNHYAFGQGLIKCDNKENINVISIMMDSLRVALDYGMLRFTLGILHRPIFGMKSSFFVAKVNAERTIGFDFGVNVDEAIENVMALAAWEKGYKFGFIDANMNEQGTNSFMQMRCQRNHCFKIALRTIFNYKGHVMYKFGIIMASMYSMLLQFGVSYFVLGSLYPLPCMSTFTSLYGFVFGTTFFMCWFGSLITTPICGINLLLRTKLFLASVLFAPCSLIFDSCSLYLFFLSKPKDASIGREYKTTCRSMTDSMMMIV